MKAKSTAPKEVRVVIEKFNKFLEFLTVDNIGYEVFGFSMDEHLDFLKKEQFSAYRSLEGEWFVGDAFENGVTGIYKDGKWFYRDYWTGNDRKIDGGYRGLIADLKCSITA